MDDLIRDFLTETTENLSQLDVDLVNLEKDSHNKELLSNIFRTIHTIKGTCGFIGLSRLEKVAHQGENVLGKFRDGELEVTAGAISAILECIDRIKMIVGELENTGEEPQGDDSALLAELEAIAQGSAPDGSDSEAPLDLDETQAQSFCEPDTETLPEVDGDLEVAPPEPAAPKPAPIAQKSPDKEEKPTNKDSESSIAHQSIRVSVALLENLITTVSELVLARNQLLQIARNTENEDFKVPLQRLNHVTSELQEGLMRTRMQPIGTAWSKLPRIIRDLSRDLNKEIEVEMIGAETELDRQVIEIIKDPLTHMVRNSADHGLESPSERQQAGKKRTGKVVLNAYHAGGHIIIEISDDGRGLNKEKIKEKLISNGIVKAEDADNLSDAQIYQYIFLPGLSTAQAVTNISGRGVGMDVVRTNIEKIGGTVEVRSTPGQGTLFTIKIPLTLAIVSALIIRSVDQKFAIPQVSIIELVRASNNSDHTIEYINDHPVLRLRNKLLPLVSLDKLLGIRPAHMESSLETILENTPNTVSPITQPSQDDDSSHNRLQFNRNEFIIVAQVGSGQFGVIVDEVYDTEEIVVKPVSPLLRQMNLFAGNTILGDGNVVMILDPKAIASKVGDLSLQENLDSENRKNRMESDSRRMRYLIFTAGDVTPKAVPLAVVVRLEEINKDMLETSNGRTVIQYRDTLMPLISLSGYIDIPADDSKHVLVFSNGHEYLGLVVDEIVDIIEEELSLKMKTTDGQSYGGTVIGGKTTDLIDVDYLIRQVYPEWDTMMSQTPEGKQGPKKKIMLIDECSLYRNLIVPYLEVEEFDVMSFDTTAKALVAIEEQKLDIDLVLVDQQTMGDSYGDFVISLQRNSFMNGIPVIVLVNKLHPEDHQKYSQQGYLACVTKNDRENLIRIITDSFENTRSFAA